MSLHSAGNAVGADVTAAEGDTVGAEVQFPHEPKKKREN